MHAFVFANGKWLIANGVYAVRVALWKMEQFSTNSCSIFNFQFSIAQFSIAQEAKHQMHPLKASCILEKRQVLTCRLCPLT